MQLSVVDQSPIPAGETPAQALQNTIDLARQTERFGYARYWIAEHHSTPSFASPAPEILMARVAAETQRIRIGSGAVLLPHYSPLKVAETFRTLHALYPGRIDLGIGRAPGGRPIDSYALQRDHRAQLKDDFGEQLVELLAFLDERFPEQHPFSKITISPNAPGAPEVWLLGSSGWSADAAAQLGLPYAAAHFINPQTTRRSIEHYRENFQPSRYLDAPKVIVAAGAVCADSEDEALRLYASQRLRRLLRDRGESGPIPTPETAIDQLGRPSPPERDAGAEWPRVFAGSIDQMRNQLGEMAAALAPDELMLITVVHSHAARVRSYELLAHAFEIDSSTVDEAERHVR